MNGYLSGLISPHPSEWLTAPATNFSFILQEADVLIARNPQLLQLIENDLDRYALEKKRDRLIDSQAAYRKRMLPGTEAVAALPPGQMATTGQGRRRMLAKICYFFLIIRAHLGGIKSARAKEFLDESLSIRILLAREGVPMPSLSSILENTNKVTQETREAILDAQIQMINERGLDDFKDITIDSTVTEANSHWPTDSFLIGALAERMYRNLKRAEVFDLTWSEGVQISDIISDMGKLNFEIACASRKKGADLIREERYTVFYELAEEIYLFFAETLASLHRTARNQVYLPGQQRKLDTWMSSLQKDLSDLSRILEYSIRRVIEKEQVPTQEKVTSISDPDASFISKGQRETKLGYRPQVSKSSSGFIVALTVPEGNAADSEQLQPICDATFKRTGILPDTASFDDGYASLKNWQWLKEKGITTVSFSGSKGKKIIPDEDWLASAYTEARRMRSAVESVIFQIKHHFNFGQVMRRGIKQVRQELTAKVLAFNFYRLQYLARE